MEFEITGFLVRGHTSNKHSSVPPQGLTVKLLSPDGFVLKTAETDSRGDYAFPNVVSGEYEIVAEHPSWTLDAPSRQVLSIGFGPAEIRTDFVVSGYRIAGIIENRSGVSSFEGVSLRFSREDGSLAGIAQPDPAGIFSLAALTDGIYTVIPAVLPGAPEWTVEPSSVTVRVRGDSVDLGTVFRIEGFSIRGRVVDERGIPVEKATIGVDSRETEVETGKDGTFVLAGMKHRLYMIDVGTAGNRQKYARKDSFHFSFEKVEAKPGKLEKPENQIPDLRITHYIQCGKVETEILRHYVNRADFCQFCSQCFPPNIPYRCHRTTWLSRNSKPLNSSASWYRSPRLFFNKS